MKSRFPIHPAVPALTSAAAAIALFAVTLTGGFAYDFYGIARNDTRLQTPAAWGEYWTTSYNGGVDNLYRPLTSTSFALQSWLNGLDEQHAWRFHLVSLLMHAGVSALVAEFSRRLINARVGLIAGLFYAVHPIHVEVVTDIVGQAEMMCALGTVGAMVLFLHRPMTVPRGLAILILFIVAVLSKEQGMLLPGLLLFLPICLKFNRPVIDAHRDVLLHAPASIIEYSAVSTTKSDETHKSAMKVLTLLLCWSLGIYVFLRERIVKFWWDLYFLDEAINPIKLSHGSDRALMPLVLLGRYTQLLLVPWKLAPDYSGMAIGSVVHLNDPYFYLGIIALLAWLALAGVAIVRRKGPMLFCLLGLAITYGLVGNIVSIIGTNFAERLMYLPSVFFLMLLAMLLSQLRAPTLICVLAVLLGMASIRSFTYARHWNDRLALYEQAVRDQPGALRMYMALAYEYYERGDTPRALQTAAVARALMPEYARVWSFSSALAMKVDDLDSAQRFLRRAEELQPSMTTLGLQEDLDKKRAATQPAR